MGSRTLWETCIEPGLDFQPALNLFKGGWGFYGDSSNRPSPKFLTSAPSSGRLTSPLEEVIKAFCGGRWGDQGSVAFLGIKLLLGLRREQAGFSSSWWCVEFLLPKGRIAWSQAWSRGTGAGRLERSLGAYGELLDGTPQSSSFGLSRAIQGTLDPSQAPQA